MRSAWFIGDTCTFLSADSAGTPAYAPRGPSLTYRTCYALYIYTQARPDFTANGQTVVILDCVCHTIRTNKTHHISSITMMESYTGAVQTPHDAIILLQASSIGLIPRIKRRLKDTERAQIKAGDVFIWNEKEAKMRRWTDGRSWSASRVTGAFLTYREMESGDKSDVDKFNSNFRYKQDGLIKQSFSITTTQGDKLHLISYTTTKNFSTSKLMDKTPSKDSLFADILIPNDVYPQLGHLMTTSSRSSSQASSPASSGNSPRISASTPKPLSTTSSTQASPISSPQNPVSQQHLPSLSLPSPEPATTLAEAPRSVTQFQLPPIQSMATGFSSFPTRGQMRHDDALALRHLDMSFK